MKHIHIEGTGKPRKVVSPVDATDITRGKEYNIIRYHEYCLKAGYILDDSGFELLIRYDGTEDLHIKGRSWIVTEREAD